MPDAPGWRQYTDARRQHDLERSRGRERQMEQQREDRQRMVARHRQERAEIFRGSWKGRGALLNATRNLLAARQAQEKAEQRDRQRLRRAALDKDRGLFPSYEEWLHQRDHRLAQGWRHRERRPPGIEGPTFVRPAPQDIRAFTPVVEGWQIHYRRVGERGSPAFTDRGKEVDIFDSGRRESVLAALRLSAQQWGTFTIRGDAVPKHVRGAGCRARLQDRESGAPAGHCRRAGPDSDIGRERTTAPVRRAVEIAATRTPTDYRRHLADITWERPGQNVDLSRVDTEVAVRMRLAGHKRGEIERTIKEGAPADRCGESRDWDAYAKRTVAVAFGIPGDRLSEHLIRQHDRLRGLRERHPEEPLLRRLIRRVANPSRCNGHRVAVESWSFYWCREATSMRGEMSFRIGSFVLFTLAACLLGCVPRGGSARGQGGSASTGWHGTGGGDGTADVGGGAGAGGMIGVAGATGGATGLAGTGGESSGGTAGASGAAATGGVTGTAGSGAGGLGGVGAAGGGAGGLAGVGAAGGGAGGLGRVAGAAGGSAGHGGAGGSRPRARLLTICGKGMTCAFLIADRMQRRRDLLRDSHPQLVLGHHRGIGLRLRREVRVVARGLHAGSAHRLRPGADH